MTRRTFDGLIAWAVYVAGLTATTIGLYGLIVHGERVAYLAGIAVLAGIGTCRWARHLLVVMAHHDRLQAHLRARLVDDHVGRLITGEAAVTDAENQTTELVLDVAFLRAENNRLTRDRDDWEANAGEAEGRIERAETDALILAATVARDGELLREARTENERWRERADYLRSERDRLRAENIRLRDALIAETGKDDA